MKYAFYVDVGVLPRAKAIEYVADVAEKHSSYFNKDDRVMWIPTNAPNYTHVEVLFDFKEQKDKEFPEAIASITTGE
jgi:hypothetical protein